MMPNPTGCEPLCPGCRYRELSLDEGALKKREWLSRALATWAGVLESVRIPSPESRFGYRAKTTLACEWDGSAWKIGLRSSRLDDAVVAIPECPVHSSTVRWVAQEVSRLLPGPDRVPLVYLSVSGELATLVIKSPRAPEAEDLAQLLNAFEKGGVCRGLFLNLNPAAGRRVMSSRGWTHVWGARSAKVRLPGGPELEFGPESFTQLIPALYMNALLEARSFLLPADAIVDLCSGVGASMRLWKDAGAETIGVELGGEAARLAAVNSGATCLRGKASDRIPQLREWVSGRCGKVSAFVNPPRLGLEPEVCRWLAEELRPVRLAYLSCSAGTLSRDLSVLTQAGYAVRRIIPYDFFPGTHHVECLALLDSL